MIKRIAFVAVLAPILAHAAPAGHKPNAGHKPQQQQAGADGQTPKDQPSTVHYRSCAEVRAAEAAPLHSGDPGYSHRLDRDGDGIACER